MLRFAGKLLKTVLDADSMADLVVIDKSDFNTVFSSLPAKHSTRVVLGFPGILRTRVPDGY